MKLITAAMTIAMIAASTSAMSATFEVEAGFHFVESSKPVEVTAPSLTSRSYDVSETKQGEARASLGATYGGDNFRVGARLGYVREVFVRAQAGYGYIDAGTSSAAIGAAIPVSEKVAMRMEIRKLHGATKPFFGGFVAVAF